MKKLCLLLAGLFKPSSRANTATIPPTTTSQGNKEQTPYTLPITLDTTFNSLMDGLLADGGTNSCVSPLSYKLALAMAYNGAEGNTAELLAKLFDVSQSELNVWATEYLTDIKQYNGSQNGEYSPPTPELWIANSYWLRKGLESLISEDFTDTLTKNFYAESGIFDREPDPINEWISEATNGKITDILKEINPDAISYLVNALYFKAQWIHDFNENCTAPGEFTNLNGSKITADMIHGGADGYINTEQFEGITKRLYGGFEFTAVMPKTSDTVTLDSILESARDDSYTEIILTLPKFDFDTHVDFKEGIHPEFDELFVPHGMDGALSENAKLDADLHISKIIHQTKFTLAEAGIEASAATVIEIGLTGAFQREMKVVDVVFNKPFYFTLSDKNGEVLFVGKVTNL